ncbi:DNA pilot protein [Dipodfec virus UOA04_Rod_720]|nr:DNA pilot protein [Dipodfec virus UOA04_Rod_720]
MPFAETFGGQALLGGIGSAIQGITSGFGAKRQYKYQKKLQDHQAEINEAAAVNAYNRQLEFYGQQRGDYRSDVADDRAYNDPNAVKARYQAAGINPNAAFGVAGSYTPQQGASAQGLSNVEAAKVSGGQAGAFSIPGVDLSDAALKAAQVENIRADTDLKKGNTVEPGLVSESMRLTNQLKQQQIISEDLSNQQAAFDLAFARDTRETNVRKLQQSVRNMEQQCDNMVAEYKTLMDKHSNNDLVRGQLESQIWHNFAATALMQVQAQYHGRLSEAQISDIYSNIESRGKMMALIDEQIKETKEETTRKRLENIRKDWENWEDYKSNFGSFLHAFKKTREAMPRFFGLN